MVSKYFQYLIFYFILIFIMLGIQPSFHEENHSSSEHSILLPYFQQPVDANAYEHEQEL